MTAAKHTTGPWRTGSGDYHTILSGHGPAEVVVAHVKHPTARDDRGEAHFADAKLIAAAPDLLAACCAIMRYGDARGDADLESLLADALGKARAAIAKAVPR